MPPLNLSDLILKTDVAWPPTVMPSEPEWTVKSDQELVAVIQGSHKKQREMAFITLYNRHYEQLLRFLRHHASAEEEVKEVWSITWGAAISELQQPHRFSYADKPVIAWLTTVAHNHLKNGWRKIKRTNLVDSDVNELELENTDIEPIYLIIQGENRRYLTKALDQLKLKNERQHTIYMLTLYRHKKPKEIATILGITEELVRKDKERGLKELKRVFQEMGVYHA
jgi:RNA polymerase sigma factor (sigma-70 family)